MLREKKSNAADKELVSCSLERAGSESRAMINGADIAFNANENSL